MNNLVCYHSLDFASAKKRVYLQNLPVDPYKVQLEDYENINDLIARSIRMKKPFKPETNSAALYESDEDIAKQLPEYIDQLPQPEIEAEQKLDEAKQSDGKSSLISAETGSEAMP